MCRGDLSGNCRRWSTADVITQLLQTQHVIRMMENRVAEHRPEGRFFSIWPQRWPKNWWRGNVMHARNNQFVLPTAGKICLCLRGVNQVVQCLQSKKERRVQVYWWCLQTLDEMGLSWGGLHHMKVFLMRLDFFHHLGKKFKKKETREFLNCSTEAKEDQEELVWIC